MKILKISEGRVQLEDKEGYKYSYLKASYLSNIKTGRRVPNKFFRGNSFTEHNIKLYIEFKCVGVTYIKALELKNAHSKITLYCTKHCVQYEKTWNQIKNNNYKCGKCGEESFSNSKKADFNMIKSKFTEFGFEVVSKEYKTNIIPLKFICKIHGEQEKSWAEFQSKPWCKDCKNIEKIKNMRGTHVEFMDRFNKIHTTIEVMDEYVKSNSKMEFKCKKCGRIWRTKPHHILSGHGCKCNTSKGELRVSEILKKYNIDFKREATFKDLGKLRFDFSVYNSEGILEYLIEYDGIQHYGLGRGFFGDMKEYMARRKRDIIKTRYCRKNNIKLIRIPYWDFDKINNIIKYSSIL
jgi:hypothetical protein